jgi:hypothetical protein
MDALRYLLLCLRPSTALAAENLFLRKQLALYQERRVKPRRATDAARLTFVWLGRWFDWRQVLTIVQSNTFTRPIGTRRRECLDYMIPLTEDHLRGVLHAEVRHYNAGPL